MLQEQENLLFTIDLTLGSFELTVSYFTFSQLNSIPKGDTNYKSLKALTCEGDFFMIGTKDQSSVVVMQPSVLMYQNNHRRNQ